MNISDLLYTNGYNSSGARLKYASLQNLNGIKASEEKEIENNLQKLIDEEIGNVEPLPEKKSANDYNSDYDVLDPAIRNPAITANLSEPEWIFDKKNESRFRDVRNIFEGTTRDLSKFRYRKNIISYVNIDSRNRDQKKYPNPAHYTINLGKQFRNIESIRLESMEFREQPTPINDSNNQFVWETDYTGLEDVEDGTTQRYSVKIPSAFYTLGNFVQVVEIVSGTVQHVVPSSVDVNNKFPNFTLIIDPFNRLIRFVQRLENLIVNSLQTDANTNVITIRIRNDGAAPANTDCNVDDSGYPFRPARDDVPILLTGLNLFSTTFGNIPVSLIETTPFFPDDGKSPTSNVYRCPSPTYDTVTDEFIYELVLFNGNGSPAIASVASVTSLTSTVLPRTSAGQPEKVLIGRSLRFTVVTEDGVAENSTGTFGDYLGLTTANQNVYVNTNFDSKDEIVKNRIPWKIEGTGLLALAGPDYLFMRLETPSKPLGSISDNLSNAKSVQNTVTNNDNFYYSKIIFSSVLPGDITSDARASNKFFYNAPFVSVDSFTVSFINQKGQVLNLLQNHSFTLEITELQEILRDTLIDSRTGNVADIGAGVATTNPLS